MTRRSINLAIVDDHLLIRKLVKKYLSEQSDINVVCDAADIGELLDKLKGFNVDVLLADVFYPRESIVNYLQQIRNDYFELKVLILSMCTDLSLISNLLDLGIHGYVSKGDDPEELVRAIHAVAESRIYKNRFFTEALYWNNQSNIKKYSARPTILLSERDKKILQLIWEEKSNKNIADELYLGIRSVEKIRQDLKEKIQVKSTVGLLKYALAQKIVRSDFGSAALIAEI
jgi:DNA-binding NarL/FixJ family response regulator